MELLPSFGNRDSSTEAQQLQSVYQEKHIKEIKKELKSSFPLIKSIESASAIDSSSQPAHLSAFKPIARFESSVSLDSEIVHQLDLTPRKGSQNRSSSNHSYELRGMYDSCLSKSIEDSTQDRANANMVKFFQYLIAFKTSKIEQLSTLNNQQNIDQKLETNFNCQSKQERDGLMTTASRDTRVSSTLRQTSRDIDEQINLLENLHHNYKCDICEVSPICGPRYHCSCCEDYDECQECHKKKTHSHALEVIARPGKYRQLQKVANLLKRPNISNSSLAVTRRGKENMKELSFNRSTHC